jgi:oxysterol-binding protein-related protein 9/10/11
LKWFLAALKQQQYAGRDERDGVKKPLNAFLGELFLASWKGSEGVTGTTMLVSEQVRYVPMIVIDLYEV